MISQSIVQCLGLPCYLVLEWGLDLCFGGIAEPISHFVAPVGSEPGSMEAANFAMKTSFMHWGIHPWANYSIIGLALAYFQFRKDKPGLISSIFIPILGEERVVGPIGKAIDIFAVFATIAGVATSLGLGTLQINSGLNYLFNIPETKFVQVAIIALFEVFSHYPLGTLLSMITIVLLCTFFITSANSATFVLGMLTSNGDLNPTGRKQFIWGVVQSLLAIALLISGGLQALQTASVAAAFPFIFIMLLAIVSLMKALREEDVTRINKQ